MSSLRRSLTALVTRRYPLLSGCGTLANSGLVRLAAGEGRGEAWTRLRCGPEILAPLGDYIGRAAYFAGDLDRKISEVIRRIVRPGDRALDVGANIGVVTLQLAQLVGPGGRVDAFEPNPAVGDLLRRSVERNRFANVHLHTCALGPDDGGTLDLAFPVENAGKGTLDRARPAEGWNSVRVPVRSLSAWAAEHDPGDVRLMKIDVEGFELEVLRGASDWLSASPPDAILFESNQGHGPGEPDPVLAFLTERDYALYAIPKRLLFLRLAPLGEGVASHDILAIARPREREIVAKFARL